MSDVLTARGERDHDDIVRMTIAIEHLGSQIDRIAVRIDHFDARLRDIEVTRQKMAGGAVVLATIFSIAGAVASSLIRLAN